MILAAADCAVGKASPPPELSDFFKCELFGSLPNGKGWKNEPYKWINRVTKYVNVYRAYQANAQAANIHKGKARAQWQKENKRILNIIRDVEKIRHDS